MSARQWRPAVFASHFRKQDPQPPVDRWEELLRAEQTPSHQLVSAVARTAPLRRLFGIPSDLASASGPSLAEREARAKAIASTRLARGIQRLLGRPADRPRTPEAPPDPVGLPRVGPLLDRELDAAISVLATMAFQDVQGRGWHFQPNHFYFPLNDLAFLRNNPELWEQAKLPEGIDWDLDGQVELARRIATYAGELSDAREGTPARPGDFAWGEAFSGLDAYAYYGLIRELRPSRVVEVGAGMSSTLLRRAIAVHGEPCDVTLIDPAPRWSVLGELPDNWSVLPSLVQHVDPQVFSRLKAGDVLFYDGSHCVRTGSDVNWMFFEILPLLPPGVWVHVHDMFFPKDYWEPWIFDEGLSWNEQYLVQAFLMHNSSYQVRFGAAMLKHYNRDLLDELYPGDVSSAGSLWMEKVA